MLAFDDYPMERQQIPQVMSRFGAALFRAYKQVPSFAEGTFDKDKLYNDELGGLCRITADIRKTERTAAP